MTRHSVADIAAELDALVGDILLVAEVELTSDEFDDDTDTVSDEGRRLLLEHFRGGADPER